MTERTGAVTFKGEPMTLVGEELNVGDPAPDFTLTTTDLEQRTLADYRGKTLIIATVPSLDTSVCDREARRFNQEAANLDGDIAVLTVSMDLPFAQKRWCGTADASSVQVLSDYKDRDFAHNYGLLIKELGLFARSVIVVDKEGKVRHIDLVREVGEEPDYEADLQAAKQVA